MSRRRHPVYQLVQLRPPSRAALRAVVFEPIGRLLGEANRAGRQAARVALRTAEGGVTPSESLTGDTQAGTGTPSESPMGGALRRRGVA